MHRQCLNHSLWLCTCLILALGGVNLALQAQTPLIKKLIPEVNGRAPAVHLLTQDQRHFLWLATDRGLVRFDGIESRITVPDVDSSDPLTSLHCQGRFIYAGSRSGRILVIDSYTSQLTKGWKPGNAPINGILATADSTLWVATYGEGIYAITSTGVNQYTNAQGLGDDHTYGIVQDPESQKLLVATDQGITLFDLHNPASMFTLNMSHGLPDNLVTALLSLEGGNVLVGTQSGVLCNYNIESRQFNRLKSFDDMSLHSQILALKYNKREIWIATESEGLLSVNWPQYDNPQHYYLSEDTQRITDIMADAEGNLLVTTGQTEILCLDLRLLYFTSVEGVNFKGVSALRCSRDGTVWFATEDGLYTYRNQVSATGLVTKVVGGFNKKDKRIISLFEDVYGQIWFGTFGQGTGRYNPRNKRTDWFTEKNGLVNNNVLSISAFGNELWFATLGGASRIADPNKPVFQNFDRSSPLGSNYIYSILSDGSENLWLGTDGNGPVKWNGSQFEVLRDNHPELGRSTVQIARQLNGDLWFYSSDQGLQLLSDKKVTNVALFPNERQAEVFALLPNDADHLIVFTSAGIIRVLPGSMMAEVLDESAHYTSDYLNVISKDGLGRIWIGANEAMMRYQEAAAEHNNKPYTVIQSVMTMLQEADTIASRTFQYDQNHIAFHFCGLWLRDPERVTYSYLLDGYSTTWVETRDRTAVFPHLPAGTYTFRVRSIAGGPAEQSHEASFTFTIAQPYWREAWFYVVCAFVLLFIAALFIRLRFSNLRKNEAQKRILIQSQFETLRNQVNPHFLFNALNTLVSLIETDTKASVEYVETLAGYFRIILQQRDKDAISVLEEITLSRYYLLLQSKRYGPNLHCLIDLDVATQQTLIPPLTLQMLMENAVKHNEISKERPLQIEIFKEHGCIVVRNNLQRKIHSQATTGLGLQNIRNRYQILFHKEVQVTENDNYFTVKLPLIESVPM